MRGGITTQKLQFLLIFQSVTGWMKVPLQHAASNRHCSKVGLMADIWTRSRRTESALVMTAPGRPKDGRQQPAQGPGTSHDRSGDYRTRPVEAVRQGLVC